MGKRDSLVVGLDIGTTKICTVVGEMADGQVNIIGLGTFPSKGLRKGVVINIESTVQSIKKAVEEAELMADCHITSVYVGIAGGHIKVSYKTQQQLQSSSSCITNLIAIALNLHAVFHNGAARRHKVGRI